MKMICGWAQSDNSHTSLRMIRISPFFSSISLFCCFVSVPFKFSHADCSDEYLSIIYRFHNFFFILSSFRGFQKGLKRGIYNICISIARHFVDPWLHTLLVISLNFLKNLSSVIPKKYERSGLTFNNCGYFSSTDMTVSLNMNLFQWNKHGRKVNTLTNALKNW